MESTTGEPYADHRLHRRALVATDKPPMTAAGMGAAVKTPEEEGGERRRANSGTREHTYTHTYTYCFSVIYKLI